MSDKKSERAILDMVYGDGEFQEIIDSEGPDFRLRRSGQASSFGVEVTEFYYSESNARVRHIPGYVTELLAGGRYRHKDDIKTLPVREVTLVRDGEPERKIEGILQSLPGVSEYICAVAEVIRGKNERLRGYVNNLTHVNLIVFDTQSWLFQLAAEDFSRCFLTLDIRAALRDSGFREVYFVTRLEMDRWVYIPTKLVLLLSELYLFDHILLTYYPALCTGAAAELSLFGQYLKRRGMDQVRIRGIESECEVLWSGYGVLITDDKRCTVHNYADYQTPADACPIEIEQRTPFTDVAFDKRVSTSLQNHTFTCGLAYDVRSESGLV